MEMLEEFCNGSAQKRCQPFLARLGHPRPQTRSAAIQLGEGDSARRQFPQSRFLLQRALCFHFTPCPMMVPTEGVVTVCL